MCFPFFPQYCNSIYGNKTLRCQVTADEPLTLETEVPFDYISTFCDSSLSIFIPYIFFSSSENNEIKWNFKKASTVIDSMEIRMDATPAYKDLIPLLHNIKRHLVDFERTSKIDKELLTRPFLLKQDQPSNREVINRKESSLEVEGMKTFKGHKVIQITDDFEGIAFGSV